MRLDQYLLEHDFVDSRTKAQNLIKAGKVSVDGVEVLKPSFRIEEQTVDVSSEKVYVSRAAYKLKGFLVHLPFSVSNLDTLDIGSSTGGFTEVLLEEGAERVTAVDVGSNQLHSVLKEDKRVISLENMDIRHYKPGRTFDLVTSDVSFISLVHILDAIDGLAGQWIILLFKPQFEVGRNVKRDKNGVVRDNKAIQKAKELFEKACEDLGWKLIETQPSSLKGKEGNVEQCYCFRK